MNNDSSPSSAARAADITSNNNTTAASDERQPGRANGPSNAASLHPERRRRPKRRKKKHDPGLRKKFDFMTHLLKNLDALFFAELSAVYYMECSLFRLLARVCSQAVFLAPRTEAFPILMEINRLSFILILLPNLYCLLVHIFTPVPTGPEYHRGYQHGGVIIDFVGQKPPQYKLYYVLLDFFLLTLQLLIYTIQHEREQLRKKLGLFKIPAQPQQVLLAGRTLQELDQEERGEAGLDETEDIELREMPGASRDDNAVTSRDDNTGPPRGDGSSSRRSSEDGPSASHLADMMISGNAIIGEFRVIHSIRSATGHPLETAGQSLQTIGYSATFAALDARRRSAAVRAGAIPQA